MTDSPGDQILGVDRELIERFLTLFLTCYPSVDPATYFLERSEGISNGQSFVNVRDAMSHFVTALDPQTPEEKKAEQLPNCEEHLRRAILEPYETTLYERLVKLDALVEDYKRDVIPVVEKYPDLRDAPNETKIDFTREAIRELALRGRAAKGKNLWNHEWQEGVEAFTEGYERAKKLFADLEKFHYRLLAIRRRRRDLLIAVVVGIIGVAATAITWLLR